MAERKMKRCSLCEELKPIKEFSESTGAPEGRLKNCKDCVEYFANRKPIEECMLSEEELWDSIDEPYTGV